MSQPERPLSSAPKVAALPVPKMQVSQALIAELQQRKDIKRQDFAVESWQPSFFARLLQKLTGRS
jgi:hypothetical protein